MTRKEMIGFIMINPNVKVTHRLFSKDEYIYSNGNGCVYEEHGYPFEDFISKDCNGIRARSGGAWENGWSLYKDAAEMDIEYRVSHTGKEIREWCEECTENETAKAIKAEYFGKKNNHPSERVYYFVEIFPEPHLVRDCIKSPKRYCHKTLYDRWR